MEPAAREGVLADILGGATPRLDWDLSDLFVGGELDERFVRFLDGQRERIARLLLDEKRRQQLLQPLWEKLSQGFDGSSGTPSGRAPTLEHIALTRRLRSALVATVDTVLLRFVLYRYLEAQFGYALDDGEQREIAFGGFDDLLAKTVSVSREALDTRRKGRGRKTRAPDAQLALFAHVDQPEEFTREVRQRSEWYQQQAGGDLHHGTVAEAADVLQDYLLRYERDAFAELLAGTSTDDYSFHYADLDPRAFQRFYEGTIGTDLRVPHKSEGGKGEVAVVAFHRNRKEQGAYYTDERLCRWLVERTLGRLYDAWEARFLSFVETAGRKPKGRLPAVRALLDELMSWRVLDPTCGGGIFLRAAFQYLAQKHERITGLVRRLPEDVSRTILREAPYSAFAESAEAGEWEWHILVHMLYGVDVDVKAINVASNLLTLSALSYKRNGVCFPSFIHCGLKPGNALVNPLPTGERGAFARRHGASLAQLIGLRRRLRDLSLDRGEWKMAHAEAREITSSIVRDEVSRAYDDVFGDLSSRELLQRVHRVGVFLYEAEFPEVFFEVPESRGAPKVKLRTNPGFDVIVGNPPWEEPAAEGKQFFPEFDPEFSELKGQAALRREKALMKDPEIARRWTDFVASVDDYKRLLTAGWYEHQRRRVRGRFPGAHTNLYKYATETAWKMAHDGSRIGLVLDGGLWSDLAASGVRELLLDHGSELSICGFTNNEELFKIHRSYKFGATVVTRGGRCAIVRAVFMQREFADLEAFDERAVEIDADTIRRHPRDSYPIPEVRNQTHLQAELALSAAPSLLDDPWNVDTYSREFNAGEQRSYFLPLRARLLPLVQGEQFNHFGVHFGELPTHGVDPSVKGGGGFLLDKQRGRLLDAVAAHLKERGKLRGKKREAAMGWVKAVTGKKAIPAAWIRLDWEQHRLAWRDIARNDDRRSLIAGVVPARVALTHTAPYVRPFRLVVNDDGIRYEPQYEDPHLLYLAAMSSSFALDAVVRSRLAKTHLTAELFRSLPVPPWSESAAQLRLAELCARLTCLPATEERPWADYETLARSVGLSTDDALVDDEERYDAEVELNALAAEQFGLGRTEFRFLMDTLFMTPKHKGIHAVMRDTIARRLG